MLDFLPLIFALLDGSLGDEQFKATEAEFVGE